MSRHVGVGAMRSETLFPRASEPGPLRGFHRTVGRSMTLRQASAERTDHEEQPPELVGLDVARSLRCQGASISRSRQDFPVNAHRP